MTSDPTHPNLRKPDLTGAGKLVDQMRAYRLDFRSTVTNMTSGKRRKEISFESICSVPKMAFV